MSEKVIASIIIPTYKAEPWLGELLPALKAQELNQGICEFVFIDSESSDNTLSILKGWSEDNPNLKIKVFPIKKEEFNHGLSLIHI